MANMTKIYDERTGFSDLPGELRNMIYREVIFKSNEQHNLVDIILRRQGMETFELDLTSTWGLARTCAQVGQEIGSIILASQPEYIDVIGDSCVSEIERGKHRHFKAWTCLQPSDPTRSVPLKDYLCMSYDWDNGKQWLGSTAMRCRFQDPHNVPFGVESLRRICNLSHDVPGVRAFALYKVKHP
ncbi:MAG: hypothetical protein M1820_003258 [Bogoriella megaspora]|nr:MAG: hypothetical protein M1820_003258 [Bogoriella megaspora]